MSCLIVLSCCRWRLLFMDDNTTLHHIGTLQTLLEVEDINYIDWPACFPDLSSTKYLRNTMGRRIYASTPSRKQLEPLPCSEGGVGEFSQGTPGSLGAKFAIMFHLVWTYSTVTCLTAWLLFSTVPTWPFYFI